MSKLDTFELNFPDGTSHTIQRVSPPSARHIRLSLTRSGLRLSAPRYVRRSVLEAFLRQQSPWIQQQLNRHGSLPPNAMLYLGKTHQLEVLTDAPVEAQRVRASQAGQLQIYPVTHTAESVLNQIERWLKTQAGELASPLVIEHARRMNVEVPVLRFRDTATRWGSCTHQGAITLNWRLVHAPLPVMRYVVIHELAHRVHLNHSSQFWDLVNQHDSEHLVHRGWLKRNGHLCRSPEIIL